MRMRGSAASFLLGGKQASLVLVDVERQVETLVAETPAGGPDWGFRVPFTILLPTGK